MTVRRARVSDPAHRLRGAIYKRISEDREGRELGVERQDEDVRALLISDSPLSGVADADDPVVAYNALPAERQRTIAATLLTVTVLPGKPGRRPVGAQFDYDRIVVEPAVAFSVAA